MSVSAPHPIRLQRTSLSFPPTNSHYYNSQQASRSAAKGAGPSGMLGIVVSEPEHFFPIRHSHLEDGDALLRQALQFRSRS